MTRYSLPAMLIGIALLIAVLVMSETSRHSTPVMPLADAPRGAMVNH